MLGLIASACTKQIKIGTFENEYNDFEGATCVCNVDVRYQYFKKFPGDDAIRKALNAEIAQLAFGQYDTELYIPMNSHGEYLKPGIPLTQALPGDWYDVSAQDMADRFHTLVMDSFHYDRDDHYSNSSAPWSFSVDGQFGESFKNLQSYRVWTGQCPGSAAINYEELGIVLDVNTGRKVSLDEIVPLENQTELKRMLAAKQGMEEFDPDLYWLPRNFNISEDGITFFTNINTWAYDPDVEHVTLSWDDVAELVDKSIFTTSYDKIVSPVEKSKRLLKRYFSQSGDTDNNDYTGLNVDIAYLDDKTGNEETVGTINRAIGSLVFDIPLMAEVFDLEKSSDLVKSYTERIGSLPLTEAAPLFKEAMAEFKQHDSYVPVNEFEYWINSGFGPRYKKWQNYASILFVSTGANHVPNLCRTLLLDMESGKPVGLDEVIPQEKQSQVLPLLKNRLDQIAGEEADWYHLDELTDTFFVTSDGISWLYKGVYPADYYIDIDLSWSELKGIVREAFLP